MESIFIRCGFICLIVSYLVVKNQVLDVIPGQGIRFVDLLDDRDGGAYRRKRDINAVVIQAEYVFLNVGNIAA